MSTSVSRLVTMALLVCAGVLSPSLPALAETAAPDIFNNSISATFAGYSQNSAPTSATITSKFVVPVINPCPATQTGVTIETFLTERNGGDTGGFLIFGCQASGYYIIAFLQVNNSSTDLKWPIRGGDLIKVSATEDA